MDEVLERRSPRTAAIHRNGSHTWEEVEERENELSMTLKTASPYSPGCRFTPLDSGLIWESTLFRQKETFSFLLFLFSAPPLAVVSGGRVMDGHDSGRDLTDRPKPTPVCSKHTFLKAARSCTLVTRP